MNEIQQKLLTYLGSCVFETEKSPRLIPQQEEMTELFNLAEKFAIDQFLLYYYREQLSKELLQRARINYLTFAGEDVKHLRTSKEIERILTKNSVDYCLLKGSYLVKDIYPESALRFRGDIDFLVRSENGLKAFDLLTKQGWLPEHGAIKVMGRHLPPQYRKGWSRIEIHTHLFNAESKVENKMLWNIIDSGAKDELMLAHVLQHCFISHDFENSTKTIFDIGYMLKNREINLKKLSDIENEIYGCEFMPLFLQSFKEFFPAKFYSQYSNVNEELCTILRDMFFQEFLWKAKEKASLKLAKSSGGKGILRHVLKFFGDIKPSYLALRFSIKSIKKIYFFYPYFVIRLLIVYTKYGYSFCMDKRDSKESIYKKQYLENVATIQACYKSYK